jgi:hypothetical protein
LAKKYFRENPGTIFIAAFQVLLVVVAILLVQRFSDLAGMIAVYAFEALVAGVAIQVVIALRNKEE